MEINKKIRALTNSEKIFKPENTEKNRNHMFNLGYWFSLSLPMLIPISLLIEYL